MRPATCVQIALRRVIVEYADPLQIRVDNRRADKLEAAFEQVFGYLVRQRGVGWYHRRPAMHGHTANEAPQVGIEPALVVTQAQVGARIGDGCGDFQAIAHDARISQQLRHLVRIVPGDLARIPVVEGQPIGGPLVENGRPAQPGLRTFEIEHFEQPALVMTGNAPLFIVISDVQGIGGRHPGTAGDSHRHGPLEKTDSTCDHLVEALGAFLLKNRSWRVRYKRN